MAQTTADARGMKRICTGCGARFYDMNKRPINCPNCDTEFTGEVKARGRRGRAAANDDYGNDEEAETETEVETEEAEAENEDVVSIEDIEDGDDEDMDGDDIETLDDMDDEDDLDDELDVETEKEE
ncbi:MAG: TIGR02300 family protein [Alphaproteobacteria bacterium]|nr:TIGR02300 family protein [Alphaproteobacteria bacterium]